MRKSPRLEQANINFRALAYFKAADRFRTCLEHEWPTA